MTLRQRIRFYQQLSVLARAGVPLRGSLERLRDRMPSRVLTELSAQVNAGERLADAFAKAGFSPLECHLVGAGERSGHLDAVLEHLAEYWSRDQQLRRALVLPLVYPIVVMHLVFLVSAIITGVTSSVPAAIAQFVVGLLLFYLICAGIYVAARLSWATEAARRMWTWVPLVGGMLSATFAYRWITALRVEFAAGVTLSRAVSDAWLVSGYAGSEAFAREGEEAIRQGTTLSQLMNRWRTLPRDWIDFVETGELSGKLEQAFIELEAEAARMWRAAHDRLTEWGPKILYFAALIYVAVQVGSLMYKVEVQPMQEIEKEIDNAGR